MRSKARSTFVSAAAAALVISSAGLAVADDLYADGDGLTPVKSQDMSLGTVCLDGSVTETALLAIRRQGNEDNLNQRGGIFDNGAEVMFSVQSVTGDGLRASIDPTVATVTLPSDWDSADTNTMSGAVTSLLTFAPTAIGEFNGSITYSASGTALNGDPLMVTDTMNVSAEVSDTGDCAPVVTDDTPPSVTAMLDPADPDGDNGWYTSDVTVSWTVADDESDITETSGCETVTVNYDTTGETFTCSATSAGGTTSESVTVKRDATAPPITWSAGSPGDGAEYYFGDTIPGADCSAEDATSGVTEDGCDVTGGGTTVGTQTLTASAKDNAGNQATDTRSYDVLAWTLDGFYRPVDMGTDKVNTVKAGSTVPLKFNVFKGEERLTSDIGATFSVKRSTCEAGGADAIEEFSETGKTVLRYDADGQQWIQNWATPKDGAGSCYLVTVTTADGSAESAKFQLK